MEMFKERRRAGRFTIVVSYVEVCFCWLSNLTGVVSHMWHAILKVLIGFFKLLFGFFWGTVHLVDAVATSNAESLGYL